MAWVVSESASDRAGQQYGFPRVFILSNVALAAGTVDLINVITTAGFTLQNLGASVISVVCDAASAGSLTFNTGNANIKRKVTLVAGENTRKAENSPYFYGHTTGLSMVTDVTLNDLQIVVRAV